MARQRLATDRLDADFRREEVAQILQRFLVMPPLEKRAVQSKRVQGQIDVVGVPELPSSILWYDSTIHVHVHRQYCVRSCLIPPIHLRHSCLRATIEHRPPTLGLCEERGVELCAVAAELRDVRQQPNPVRTDDGFQVTRVRHSGADALRRHAQQGCRDRRVPSRHILRRQNIRRSS